ncbi:MAG: hypothetical protein QOE68_3064, partial [Thermoanaerobaculia bacterium]|nr:hypothetical protein [Thermoanaerobaculia bacterium]
MRGLFAAALFMAGSALAQTAPPTQPAQPQPSPSSTPSVTVPPASVPPPQAPSLPGVPSAPPASAASSQPMTMQNATQAALQQATAYQQALIDEQTAGLDLTQARAALLPRV